MPDCFAVISDEVLTVLLDLPVGSLDLDKIETTEVLQSDGKRRKVHLFHFVSKPEKWRGEIDLVYVLKPGGATSLHSIGYSSSNREDQSHAAEGQDARRAHQ